jgi:hypothetical protein
MPRMTNIICKCGCGKKKAVRTADVKRGWGLFFSKSCKAIYQGRKYGQTKDGVQVDRDFVGLTDDDMQDCLDSVETGWDSHKSWL